MDFTTITQFISSIGFPVACCLFLFKYIDGTLKDVVVALNKNTVIIEKLLTLLGADNNDEN